MKYNDILGKLETLYNRDHGACDSGTCSLAKAWSAGYALMAIEQFAGSGAADDEFYSLYRFLTTRFKTKFARELEEERKAFDSDPDCEAIECGNGCGAYIYDFQWHGKEVHCDSCGKSFTNPKRDE